MRRQTDVGQYLIDISPHRKRIKHILFGVTILQGVLVFLPIQPLTANRTVLLTVILASIAYGAIFWKYLVRFLTSPWIMLLGASPLVVGGAAMAYYSEGILIAPSLLLIISTIVAYDSVQIFALTLIQEAVILLLAFTDYEVKFGDALWSRSIFLLMLSTGIVGCIATVTAFEVKERERFMVHLQELDQIKTTFIAIVSHNLRTPITVVSGYLQILERQQHKLSAEVAEIVTKLSQNMKDLTDLIEDTVRISSFQTGELKLNLTKIPVNRLLSVLLSDTFASQAKIKNLDIVMSAGEGEFIIDGDPEQLKVMFSRVIDNAIKFTAQGTVSIVLSRSGTDVLVEIADTGSGIPEEYQKLLFSQFSRSGSILRYDKKGVGLGLYITKLIVEAHQGKIWFKSKPNAGTTVFIQLPVSHEAVPNK